MKILAMLMLAASLLSLTACETQTTETTHSNLLGGTTHERTDVTRNPVTGDVSVDRSKTTTH